MPAVVVTTTAFLPLAVQAAATLGVPGARLAVVEHPLGGVPVDAVVARADGLVDSLVSLLTR